MTVFLDKMYSLGGCHITPTKIIINNKNEQMHTIDFLKGMNKVEGYPSHRAN